MMDIYVPYGFRGDDYEEPSDIEYYCHECDYKSCNRQGFHQCWVDNHTISERPMKFDSVDHPQHYNAGRFEVIDVIEDWKLGFNLGNAVKYIARADYKGKRLEDLLKAKWYIEREIAREEKNGS